MKTPKRDLTPHVERTFEHGCALEPADALRAWLDAHAGHVLRVPCVLPTGELATAQIGELACRIDDSRMGVGIATRGRGGEAMWLEGHWRAPGVFVVIWFAGLVTEPVAAVELELVS